VATKTTEPGDAPRDYDPFQFPAFAVTVDVVVLTMFEGTLHVLLVRRGEAPFEGMWAIPGGFKRPTETLDEAARRELGEETGVDAASLLTQFGAYGDPGRDPRMHVVTVAYLAVLREVGSIVAGSDAAEAALMPVSDVLKGKVDLAFDHRRIVRDAIERVRVELEVTGIATAFVGTTFTLAELRAVYEAVWGVQLDAANFTLDLNGIPAVPNDDQLDGAAKDWYPVGRWVDVSDGKRGVTLVPLDAPLEKGEQGRTPKPAGSPEWLEIRDKALAALTKSKDLRVLALLGAALLRTEGPYAFCHTVALASKWLSDYWETVYPLAGEDTIERQSALSGFADQFAIVDALRRAPIVSSRQHGRLSLRDIETAGPGPVDGAFDELSLGELQRARQRVTEALQALARMDARVRAADPEAVLSFDAVSAQLTRLDQVLRAQLVRRPESGVSAAAPPELAGAAAAGAPANSGAPGAIKTRQDAIRALDAVAAFFQQTEPSSPVPLLLDRAKRLVSKSFLEVLADIAPGALNEARVASGVKGE